jgi:hypothetical protein
MKLIRTLAAACTLALTLAAPMHAAAQATVKVGVILPLSGGAGRSVSSTRLPPCTPTPTARVRDFRVRCASIGPL